MQAKYDADSYASDAIDRPVYYRGHIFGVISAPDEAHVTLSDFKTSETITAELVDCLPLCIDCCEPLVTSEYEAPGSCANPACFLYRGERS